MTVLQERLERCQKLCTKLYFQENMSRLPCVFILKEKEHAEIIEREGCAISARAVIDFDNKHYPIDISEDCLLGEGEYLWETVLHEVAHALHWESLSRIDDKISYLSRTHKEFHDSAWEKINLSLVERYPYVEQS